MPEDRLEDQVRPFNVYWNVPTKQCKSKRIPFENLQEKYGILQNKNDSFRGEVISILYDPGLFPALLKNETSGKFKFRNGGVPQEGDLELHLETFKSVLEQSIPNPEFHGVGIIDFESWRPIFRQNFGVLVPYKDISNEMEKKMHWWWPKQWIQAEAKQRFEEAARTFMQTTVSVAKQMRPKALWGYYGFPYCFNMANNKMKESCADKVPEENDRTYWLWSESTALYPSVYSSKDLTSSQLAGLIRGRVKEAERVKRTGTSILPYFWFRYREGGYLSEEDLNTALETLYKSNASGFIIWGSSNDVNTVNKCKKLLQYLENIMGPAISAYTKPSTKLRDDIPQIPISRPTTWYPEIQTHKQDPEFHWEPPENYAQDIKNYVEQEIKRKGQNFSQINESMPNLNDSVLMEIILNSLMEERNMNKNEKKGLPFVDITTDSYRQSHVEETSQAIDVSTDIIRSYDKKETNIFFSTESLPTELLNNSQTETKNYSPENFVTKLLQNKHNATEISSSTISSTEIPNYETSQMSGTEFLVTKLLQNLEVTTEISISETTEQADLKDVEKHLSTDFITVQDDYMKREIDWSSKLPSTESLPYEKHISGTSSIGLSTIETTQDKQTPTLSTEGISTEFENNFNESSEKLSSEELVTKFLQKDNPSTDMSTTNSVYSSDESSDKIFSGEYLATKLFQSNQKEILDTTTETTADVGQTNYKHKKTVTINYLETKQSDISETTTLENLRTSDSVATSKRDAENIYEVDQKRPDISEMSTTETSDFSVEFTASTDSTNTENYRVSKHTENELNVPFFNQDTFLDNTENPVDDDAVFIDNSTQHTRVFDNRNEAIESVSGFISTKEESGPTLASTTDLDQVNVYVL